MPLAHFAPTKPACQLAFVMYLQRQVYYVIVYFVMSVVESAPELLYVYTAPIICGRLWVSESVAKLGLHPLPTEAPAAHDDRPHLPTNIFFIAEADLADPARFALIDDMIEAYQQQDGLANLIVMQVDTQRAFDVPDIATNVQDYAFRKILQALLGQPPPVRQSAWQNYSTKAHNTAIIGAALAAEVAPVFMRMPAWQICLSVLAAIVTSSFYKDYPQAKNVSNISLASNTAAILAREVERVLGPTQTSGSRAA